jgi:hypothetical protein
MALVNYPIVTWERSPIIVFTIGKKRFDAVKQHYLATGLTTRRHGNTRRLPANALSFRETQNALKFLHAYAESNAILLPGRIPGYKRDDLQLLPSSTTKKVCINREREGGVTSDLSYTPCM